MSDNPHANGGLLLKQLRMPDFRDYAVDVPSPVRSLPRPPGARENSYVMCMKLNSENQQFPGLQPRREQLQSLAGHPGSDQSMYVAEILPEDDNLAPDGRVMEVLSEHQCQGWLEGYLLTGPARFLLVATKPLSISLIRCSISTPSGLRSARHIPWRRPIASLNYLLTSHVWRQDHNGFSHQDPGFIDHVVNKKAEVVRVYLPPDANMLVVGHRPLSAQPQLRQCDSRRQTASAAVADHG